jgi:drug/metabolite transporter (DMT)-like permease
MPSDVMLVVLLGAALHASWNGLIKSGDDKLVDTSLITAGAAVLAGVSLPFLPLPAQACWPYRAASVAIHVLYFALVAAAYRAGDMSFAYPLMRGTGPLIVAVLSAAVLGERLSAGAWAGVLLICGGVLGLALAYRRPHGSIAEATALALGNALVIALYTFVDGVGVRLSGQAFAYTFWMFLLTAPFLLAWPAFRRLPDLRAQFAARWRLGLIGGACTLGSYALALWAMTKAPIAPVAALRETSILFGMAIAALVLKERFGWARIVAAAAIALGTITLRLG